MNSFRWSDIGRKPPRIWSLLVPLIAVGVYVERSLLLRHWIVDDAAISFSYARSFAHGLGLVPQLGAPPVEGFSNPLWVFTQVPFFLCGFFDPFVIPKVVATLFVLGSFVLLFDLMSRTLHFPAIASSTVLVCTAVNSSFVVWTSSGLENAQLVFLVVLLTSLTAAWSRSAWTFRKGIILGIVTALVALARPDSVVYLLFLPILLIWWIVGVRREELRSSGRALLGFAISVTVIFGGYLLMRRGYFGTWYPNTYYVKGGPSPSDLLGVVTLRNEFMVKWEDLLGGLASRTLWLPLWLALAGGMVLAVVRRKDQPALIIPVFACLLAGFVQLVMPGDYMREFRFATPFIPLAYLCVGIVVIYMRRRWPRPLLARVVGGTALGIACVFITWREHDPRLRDFARWPTVSFERIRREYGFRYDQLAAKLDVTGASVLLPDIGAPLYYSSLRVYDLAGLCDRTIARTRGVNQPAFFDYIFDTIKPTFIHTHGFFSAVSRFERDPRFGRDYIAIADSLEPYYNDSVPVGDWIRRDVIAGRDSVLGTLKTMLSNDR